MRYLPHTPDEISAMLEVIGKENVDQLFDSIPQQCRMTKEPELPEPLSEWQLDAHMNAVASQTRLTPQHKIMVGAGSYHHYVPEMITALASRSEFVTAYTPYQPEMAQGTLQGIYEYQTLTARLLGMDVANASLYDGGSALAESMLMGLRINKKQRSIAISAAIHPHHRQVLRTYLMATDFTIIELPVTADGRTDLSPLAGNDDIAAVAVQSPNFFGVVEDLAALGEKVHDSKALFVCSFTEPLSYGLLKNPGECGADIACGEGQSFGLQRSFGGPGLGMFACREKFTRNVPGRLVGITKDREDRRGFVLTLATREQHIRREKATSNICSNQGVCAMMAGMYMASLGGSGLRELAQLNYAKAEYFKKALCDAGATLVFDSPTFNEFLVRLPEKFATTRKELFEQGYVAGLPIEKYYPQYKDCYLFCATEAISKEDMDTIARGVKK
ncbi:MAG: aminomethyl-transferring glycine dehydrogenase [Deltaproteobacteria bacterium]|nr:MAG: aminomethyl-transferring glycine dehydrogenase [Deltaproteobacteria bacterium]